MCFAFKTHNSFTCLAQIYGFAIFQVIAEYNKIKLNVHHANFINTEYLESKKYTFQLDDDESLRTFSSKMSSSKSTSSSKMKVKQCCNKLRVRIDENGKFYRVCMQRHCLFFFYHKVVHII